MEECIVEPLVIGGRSKITTTLQNFSSCNYKEAAFNEYDCDDDNFKKYFNAKFYCNGYCENKETASNEYDWLDDNFKKNVNAMFYCNGKCDKNEGYVSIIFHANFFKLRYSDPLKFSCVASVIDSSGDKRFPQTALVIYEYGSEDRDQMRLIGGESYKCTFMIDPQYYSISKGFGFEKYIKRSTLLSDPSELLPNDSLSLCLEIEYEVLTREEKIPKYGAFESHIKQDGNNWYLRMYSDFGRELCKMSSVLRRMVCSSMIESKTGLVKFPPEEIDSLRIIFCILGRIYVRINTMTDICDLYILADMYDMQQIIDVCRQFFVCTIHTMHHEDFLKFVNKNIKDIIELARNFSKDEILVDILRILSDYSDKLKNGDLYGLTLSEFLDSFSVIELETEWSVACLGESSKVPFLLFNKLKTKDLPRDIYK